jgi:regulator of replication initiation timing
LTADRTMEFIASQLNRVLMELAEMRDDARVTSAIINRIDTTQSSFIEELRAMRMTHDRLRQRVDALDERAAPPT